MRPLIPIGFPLHSPPFLLTGGIEMQTQRLRDLPDYDVLQDANKITVRHTVGKISKFLDMKNTVALTGIRRIPVRVPIRTQNLSLTIVCM